CLGIVGGVGFPGGKVDGVEISKDGIDVARINVAEHGLKDRVRLFRGDLYAPLGDARYDLIITNPPYVDAAGMASLPPECLHEPRIALAAGADGLRLVRRIVEEAPRHLVATGGLMCEVGRGRAAVERAFADKRFLWLDTEESSGEVFWIDAEGLRVASSE